MDGTDHPDQRPQFQCGHISDVIARRLLTTQRRLTSAALASDARTRLQRRLAAVCDAMKAPGADAARIARRLDRLLADIGAATKAGRADDSGGRDSTHQGRAR
jgi:hypothetical protein